MSDFSFSDVLAQEDADSFYQDFLAALKKRKKRVYRFDLSQLDRASYAPFQALAMAFKVLSDKGIAYEVDASDAAMRGFKDLGLMSLLSTYEGDS